MSVSFPYFSLARDYGVDYGWVLKHVALFENDLRALAHWRSLGPAPLSEANLSMIAIAVEGEHDRRAIVRRQVIDGH
jgi:hypothetical protein